jgi:predicted DNA-binding transcriptional regulator AlpA
MQMTDKDQLLAAAETLGGYALRWAVGWMIRHDATTTTDVRLNKKQVAQHLGLRDADTIDRWIRNRDFPHGKKNGRAREWKLSEIEAWTAAKDQGVLDGVSGATKSR